LTAEARDNVEFGWGNLFMRKRLSRFLDDRTGTTAIEYSLIAVLIAITIIGAASQIGKMELNVTFTKINGAFTQ
jgi:Flp pilus assembly pilin Flp